MACTSIYSVGLFSTHFTVSHYPPSLTDMPNPPQERHGDSTWETEQGTNSNIPTNILCQATDTTMNSVTIRRKSGNDVNNPAIAAALSGIILPAIPPFRGPKCRILFQAKRTNADHLTINIIAGNQYGFPTRT